MTLSNIVKEVELIREDPQGSDKAYISDGAVTLKIVGDDPHPTINYYTDAEITDGFFVPAGESKSVEVTGNSVTLTEPGYYSGFVYFGGDFSFSSTATFVIQVVGEGDSANNSSNSSNDSEMVMTEFNLVDKNSGFTIKFPNYIKTQHVKGSHEES